MDDQRRPSGRVESPVNSLSDLNLSHESLDSVLHHVGRLGVGVLQGWDAAATTLVERDKVATFGSTDDRVDPVDQFQYDKRSGPCVDALGGDVQYLDGNEIPPRWRQFAEFAANHDVYSVLSFPLCIDGEVIGALNFYSRERDALRTGQREEGSLFAAQAAVTVANAKSLQEAMTQARQLEDALQTRTLIGQATGLLMGQEGLTSDEAFQRLVKVSQNANLKLREIAQRYVETWESKARNGG
ncbi:MAG TPA: GAF and ANTAR domain-containing protein [Actinomycetota bacterium]|nr:GAF and ANTAR domain-containing protein [Actinomycetota bacterium]